MINTILSAFHPGSGTLARHEDFATQWLYRNTKDHINDADTKQLGYAVEELLTSDNSIYNVELN